MFRPGHSVADDTDHLRKEYFMRRAQRYVRAELQVCVMAASVLLLSVLCSLTVGCDAVTKYRIDYRNGNDYDLKQFEVQASHRGHQKPSRSATAARVPPGQVWNLYIGSKSGPEAVEKVEFKYTGTDDKVIHNVVELPQLPPGKHSPRVIVILLRDGKAEIDK